MDKELCWRLHGGGGDRAGMHDLLGVCIQRHARSQSRCFCGNASVDLYWRSDFQYAGIGWTCKSGRPHRKGDVWDIKKPFQNWNG